MKKIISIIMVICLYGFFSITNAGSLTVTASKTSSSTAMSFSATYSQQGTFSMAITSTSWTLVGSMYGQIAPGEYERLVYTNISASSGNSNSKDYYINEYSLYKIGLHGFWARGNGSLTGEW